MPPLENTFSWSHTRDTAFRRCPRQYFFNYYASWGGWERNAPPRTRAAYVLKQLRTRKAWAGETVHNTIRHTLQALRDGGTLFTPETIIDQTLQQMRHAWRDSGEGAYWQEPKKTCALWEHEYEIEIPDQEWKAIVEHALTCLRTFFASETFRALAALPRTAWLEIENLASFELNGTKIHVQLDFAHRHADHILIYDWKTGRADKQTTRDQLATYILYAAQRWSIPPENITAREYNLATNTLHDTTLTTDELAAQTATITEAATELRALHGKPEDTFPLAPDEAPCKTCNFLRLCPRYHDDTTDGA